MDIITDRDFSDHCDEPTRREPEVEPDADDKYQLLVEEPDDTLKAQAERLQRHIDEHHPKGELPY